MCEILGHVSLRRADVFCRKVRVVAKDMLNRVPGREAAQNVLDRDPRPRDPRTQETRTRRKRTSAPSNDTHELSPLDPAKIEKNP